MIKWASICLLILFLIYDAYLVARIVQDLMDYLKRRKEKE